MLKVLFFPRLKNGAGGRTRTDDRSLTRRVLYQLSYAGPLNDEDNSIKLFKNLVLILEKDNFMEQNLVLTILP